MSLQRHYSGADAELPDLAEQPEKLKEDGEQ
jgi:hypothetical protein